LSFVQRRTIKSIEIRQFWGPIARQKAPKENEKPQKQGGRISAKKNRAPF
jgi:hypothetical protein